MAGIQEIVPYVYVCIMCVYIIYNICIIMLYDIYTYVAGIQQIVMCVCLSVFILGLWR